MAAKFLALAAVDAKSGTATSQHGTVREVTRAFLLDRTYRGWAGMLIGGLEGLPHEFNVNRTRPSPPAERKLSLGQTQQLRVRGPAGLVERSIRLPAVREFYWK
jgi:hypothetical protein